MYCFALLTICLCLGLVSTSPIEVDPTTYEGLEKSDTTIVNSNDDATLRLADTNEINYDEPEETSTLPPGDDLKAEETFYPVGGVWWGVRPLWGGWWGGYKPGWHGWHRPPHWGGHGGSWGGHWGGHGGYWGGHWGGGRWR